MEMQLVVMALALFLGVWAASFIMAVAALLQTRALKRQLESLRRDLASPREPRGLAPAQRVAAYAPLTHSSHPSPGAYVSPQPYAQPYAQQQPQPYVQQPATRPAQAPSPRVVALPRPTASPELLRAVVMPQGSAPSTQSSPVSLVALPQAKLATLAPQTASPTPRAVSATQEAAPAEASQPKATTAPTTVSEPTAPASLVPNTHPLALGYRPRSMTREDGVPFARFRLPSTTTAAVPQPSSASEAKAAAPSFSAAAALANAPSVSSFQRHAESLLAPGLPPSPQPLLPSAEGAAATAHDEARPDGSEPPEAPPLLLPEPAAKRRDLETFLGAEVFLKLGIAALVLGVVLFLAYTLSDLGALGKLGVGAACGALLLGSGFFAERKARYRAYGRGLMAGAWGIFYFTGFSAYFLPAAKVLESPYSAAILLFCIALAAVLWSLRYRNEWATLFAFQLIYSSLALSAWQTNAELALLAEIGAAMGLAFVAWRMTWSRLFLFGIVSSWSSMAFTAFMQFEGPNRSPGVIAALALTWATFHAVALWPRQRPALKWAVSGYLLNAVGAFVVSAIVLGHDPTIRIHWSAAFFAVLYLSSALLFAHRGQRVLYLLSTTIGLSALALISPLYQDRAGVSSSLSALLIAELTLVLGVLLRERYFRLLSYGAFTVVLGELLLWRMPLLENGRLGSAHASLFAAYGLIIAINALLSYTRLRATLPRKEARAMGVAFSSVALLLFMLLIFWDTPATARPSALACGAVVWALALRLSRTNRVEPQSGLEFSLQWLLLSVAIGGSIYELPHSLEPEPTLLLALGLAALAFVINRAPLGSRPGDAPSLGSVTMAALFVAVLGYHLPRWLSLPWGAPAVLLLASALMFLARWRRWLEPLALSLLLSAWGVGLLLSFPLNPWNESIDRYLLLTAGLSVGALLLSERLLNACVQQRFEAWQRWTVVQGQRPEPIWSLAAVALVFALSLASILGIGLHLRGLTLPWLMPAGWTLLALALAALGWWWRSQRYRLHAQATLLVASLSYLSWALERSELRPSLFILGSAQVALFWLADLLLTATRRRESALAQEASATRLIGLKGFSFFLPILLVGALWSLGRDLEAPRFLLWFGGTALVGLLLFLWTRRQSWEWAARLAGGGALAATWWSLAEYPPPNTEFLWVSVLLALQLVLAFGLSTLAARARGIAVPDWARWTWLGLFAGSLLPVIWVQVSGTQQTVWLAGAGFVLVASGFVATERAARLMGLALLSFCVLKLFIYDLRDLEGLARIASFIGLGLILLAVSFAYTRFRTKLSEWL